MMWRELPLGADPAADWRGEVDELGRPVYVSRNGIRYQVQEPVTKERKPLAEALAGATPGGVASGAWDMAKGLVGGMRDAVTAPGRALAGEPVTNGQVMDLAGMVQLGGAAMPAPEGALRSGAARAANGAGPDAPQGFTAYHGSPHDFDRFSMDKIGTGEGAQAYGRGLYFAEAEDVARHYRDELSRTTTVDGNPIMRAGRLVGSTGDSEIDDLLVAFDGDVGAALRELDESVRGAPKPTGAGGPRDDMWTKFHADMAQRREKLAGLQGKVSSETGGHMYEVNVKADPDSFLDWDAPLGKQPPAVRDAVHRVARDVAPYGLDRVTDDMRAVEMKSLLNDPAGVAALRKAGVPGIRYNDAGSRKLGGTRNYVLFDDSIVDINRKYANASPMVGLYSAQASADEKRRIEEYLRGLQ